MKTIVQKEYLSNNFLWPVVAIAGSIAILGSTWTPTTATATAETRQVIPVSFDDTSPHVTSEADDLQRSESVENSSEIDLPAIAQTVSDQVHNIYPNAYMVEVNGTSTYLTSTIASMTSWRFVFNDCTDKPISIFAFATTFNKKIKIEQHDSIYVGSGSLTNFPSMKPGRALKLLRSAGYNEKFKFLALRIPNVSSPVDDPLFIFGPFISGGFASVDTVTEEVREIH